VLLTISYLLLAVLAGHFHYQADRTGMPEMQFAAIRETLGLGDAMCSRHLKPLPDCGYVQLAKRRGESNRHMITRASLTPAGRVALEAHLAALRAIAKGEMTGTCIKRSARVPARRTD
jgi:DNA-binding MarR family transcriptional regulator